MNITVSNWKLETVIWCKAFVLRLYEQVSDGSFSRPGRQGNEGRTGKAEGRNQKEEEKRHGTNHFSPAD